MVGRYLMRNLFLEGRHLAVVVRPTRRMNVQQRIESILQRWEQEIGAPLPRPIVFEGDVCQPDLGLQPDEISWIRKHCNQIIHSAAVLQFSGASLDQEPWRTNLGGTKNVLELSRRCEISEFHYVSTAYVCGIRHGKVMESDLECGQEFRNDYERSKYQSEQLVRQADCFQSTTVYRPAVIVGDSKTGYTSTYHGLYLYLRLLATLVPQQKRNAQGLIETPIRMPISGDEPRNVVPVDWVADAISTIFCNPEAHGKTYHLSPDHYMCGRELLEHCYEFFNSCGVEFRGDGDRSGDNEFSKTYFANVSIYQDYETSDPTFDKSNLESVFDVVCPKIDKEMTLRFMEFGIANKWGKKRESVPKVERWFDSELANIARSATSLLQRLSSGEKETLPKFGIDIHGPGGGQWQFTASSDGSFEVLPGLPESPYPVLTMDDRQVSRLLKNGMERDVESPESHHPSSIWLDPIQSVLQPTRD